MKKIVAVCYRIYWVLSAQFGIDLRQFGRSVRGLPRYIRDYFRFRSGYKGRLEIVPCLHDWYEEGGSTKTEYFWQDLLVARKIFDARPDRHVDIGSRVDGFVAHVASFREIEIFDVRPIDMRIPGITITQADLMKPIEGKEEYCDSISCLHALEHFGLGRYNDPIHPKGFECAIKSIAALLKTDGVLYLSVPLGTPRVEFNAQHIFDPRTIVNIAADNKLEMTALTVIKDGNRIEELTLVGKSLDRLANQRYALGIFEFNKTLRKNMAGI
ncbi:MAG: hypothetical protein FD165_711 [Gammaproteobacteria bacterium]|nr:MAG: hypothetical protein FD165_711 [Gammaproteobacteria bacterium]TND07038.1 MAG: hypothetical protein FD120_206 [Gammaproteobacteria bacterium]